MMHAVIRRRGEPAIEPAELAHLLGVDPELVEEVDDGRDDEHLGRNARDRHRQVEDPPEQRARARLPQRGREVVFLALVVHDVRGPEHRAFVTEPVIPVVAEVVEDHAEHPDPPLAGGQLPHGRSRVHGDVDAEPQEPREEIHDLAHHPQAQAADRVVDPVVAATAHPADRVLEHDHQEEYWCRERDRPAHTTISMYRERVRAPDGCTADTARRSPLRRP